MKYLYIIEILILIVGSIALIVNDLFYKNNDFTFYTVKAMQITVAFVLIEYIYTVFRDSPFFARIVSRAVI